MTTARDIRAAAGRVLRGLREAQAVSQEQLGFQAALHRTYVSSAERGGRNVSLEALDRWLGALGVGWAEFGAALDVEARRRPTRPERGAGGAGGARGRKPSPRPASRSLDSTDAGG